jgi:hypothetical protein
MNGGMSAVVSNILHELASMIVGSVYVFVLFGLALKRK